MTHAENSVWADLRSTAYFYRYGGFKADEVSGYFMGASLSEVLETVVEIATYNISRPAPAGADLGPQGDALVLPDPENAMFEGNPVGWEERSTTKTQMYRNILGLNPPKDRAELLKRLNASDSEWIRGVKRKVLEKRRQAARPRG
jgi:hypothetical protein